MARRTTKKIRYDSFGRVLRKGEVQRKPDRYIFQWFDNLTQKRYVIYAQTLQELREKENQIEADSRDGIRADAASITINAVFDFMMEQKKGLKENTRRTYLGYYDLYCRQSIGLRKIQEVRPIDIETFYNSLMNTGKSGHTLKNVNMLLTPVFKSAVQNDICRKNVCEGVLNKVIKNHGWKPQKKTAISEKDLSRFIKFAESRLNIAGAGFLPAIKIMLLTGCRVSEILGLIPSDIDFVSKTITIKRELILLKSIKGMPNKFSVSKPKTEAGQRVVPMSEDCIEAIRDALLFKMIHGSVSTVDGVSDFIFVTDEGTCQCYHAVNRYIHSTIKAFNQEEIDKAKKEGRKPELIEEFTCHKLRHTFAARAVENNLNPKLLQSVLGHADIATTMDVYAEFRDEKKNEAFNEIRKFACLN